MIIGTEKFTGVAPKIASHLLPDTSASNANDVMIMSGALAPFKGNTTVSAVTVAADSKTIYKHPITDLWYDFQDVTDIVRSPLADDAWNRVYWTDDDPVNVPLMAANDNFASSFELGLPAPDNGPSVAVVGAAGSDPLLAESRAYLTTYVSAYGEEGPPSAASAVVIVYPDEGNTVNVGIPTAPTGNHNVSSVRIYRTNTGSTTTEYQRVAEVAVGSGTYNDAVDSDDLGIVLPSDDWLAPLATMQGLCKHPAGFLVGFADDEVCLSVSGMPHAWPIAHRYAIGDKVVGVAVYGTSILVMTNRLPVIMTGSDPSYMTVEKLESGDACLSKDGIVDLGYHIIYPSPNGLVLSGVGSAPTVVTEAIIDKDTWESYNPAEMIAERYGNKYFCVCGSGSPIDGFLFDPATLDFMPVTTSASALFYDPDAGELITRSSTNTFLQAWDTGSAQAYAWTSKEYRMKSPVNFGAGQVFAETYPVTVKFYADDVLKHTETVADEEIFRMPSGYKSALIKYEVSGTSVVNSVMFGLTPTELGAV